MRESRATTTRRREEPPRQPAQFIEEWAPYLKQIEADAEMDFSFRNDAVMIVDMRLPNAQKHGVLYKRQEIADGADRIEGDFEERVRKFMGH